MINNDMVINENEKEEDSNISSEIIDEKIIYNNEEDEKEFELNNECELNLSTNSIVSLEKQINIDISPDEILSIKQFRNLLGILGHKANNFIVERLYQALIRISSKKYEHLSSNLLKKDFLNYLSIVNDSKISQEIFYLFFDISNKGYIAKNDFINVISNMCETICEFTHNNTSIYKEKISNLFDHLLNINMKAYGGRENNQQWISRTSFIKLIKNGSINFYDIMNSKKVENNISMTQTQYGTLKDILYSIKAMKKKIIQRENIESNFSIVTDNYLDNINIIKEEYKEMKSQNDFNNNSFNLYNSGIIFDKLKSNQNIFENVNFNNISKTNNFNKINNFNIVNNLNISKNQKKENNNEINKSNRSNNLLDKSKNDILSLTSNSFINTPKININKIKSPQERLLTNEKNNDNNNNDNENLNDLSINSFNLEERSEKDEEFNYKFLTEENEDSVCEMDNKSIKNIQNIKKMKTKKNINTSTNSKGYHLNKNLKKNFFFLKPFRIKNDKELQKELRKKNIDINNTLILLKKDNFLSYLETLENCFSKEITDINESNDISSTIKNDKLSIVLNKPLKEKEIYQTEKSFESTLNNINMELMLAIILGIEKCISSMGDWEPQDKNEINSLVQADDSYKTTRKRKNTIFLLKLDKISKKNSELYEAISNYPFKKFDYIYEEINTFNFSFYGLDKKNDNTVIRNKAIIEEYAPKIFCNIRYSFGDITNKDFLQSINIESLISNIFFGNINNLNQLLTINKENFPEFIMFSPDTKYIIKCISQSEFEFLQKILPNYYEYLMSCLVKNLQKNNMECQRSSTMVSTFSSSCFNQLNSVETKCTLLDIIYGAYSINILDKKLFFIIKKNIFYSNNNLSINKKYDLKGSSIDRTSSKRKVSDVYKDLDYIGFEQTLSLSTKISNYLTEIIEKDTLFLTENNIINYSFYIGIAEIPENYENDENEEGILSQDKNNMYYFGISDIFTEYGAGKKMEHLFKTITKGSGISAVPPIEYKKRFDNFIKLCLK